MNGCDRKAEAQYHDRMYDILLRIGCKKAFLYAWGQLQSALLGLKLLLPPLRSVLLSCFGATIGAGTVVEPCTFINLYATGFAGLRTGKRCYIGTEVLLDMADAISLEDDVTIAARVIILTHHSVSRRDHHPLAKHFPYMRAAVHFGEGCFIGAGSTILPGVTIGAMSVVGAGSVVTADVPPHTVVAGVPAKILRRIDASDTSLTSPPFAHQPSGDWEE